MRTASAIRATVCGLVLFGLTSSLLVGGEKDSVYSGRDLIGRSVKNSKGESLGQIEDFVINLKTAKIVYAALAHGETLGFGGKLFAVPPEALALSTDGKYFVLDHGRKDFQDAAGFDANRWPLQPDRRWGKTGGNEQPGTTAENTKNNNLVRLSRIRGFAVRNAQGEDLGTIYDGALALKEHRVVYLALSYGTTLGLGGKMMAVPCQALQLRSQKLDPSRQEFVLDISKQELDNSEGFKNNSWPTRPDPRFTKK